MTIRDGWAWDAAERHVLDQHVSTVRVNINFKRFEMKNMKDCTPQKHRVEAYKVIENH